MIKINSPQNQTPRKTTFAGRREDFLRTLRGLGAEIPEDLDPQSIAYPKFWQTTICCNQGRWQRWFGKEQNTTEHSEPSSETTYLAWEHQCSDGLVLCVGRHHQRAGGQRILTVQAISFY